MRIFILIFTLLQAGLVARAFVPYVNAGNTLRWYVESYAYSSNLVNPATKAIRYYLASDGYSATNRVAELNAVRACFDQWQSVPGTTLRFEDAGLVAPGIDVKQDGTNVVFWSRSTLVNGGRDNISGLRANTTVFFDSLNRIREADMVINGAQFEWFTDINNTSQAQFVEGIVTHEIGHFIGLDHTPVGAATVILSGSGVATDAGLSSDEIAAARALYPDPNFIATLGHIKGRVTLNGTGILGAAVFAEDAAGNIAQGTVTRETGDYDFPALAPGTYQIRVCPLDPSTASSSASLFRGIDVAKTPYNNSVTTFSPTGNTAISVAAADTKTQDFAVVAGEPAFRISSISGIGSFPDDVNIQRFATSLKPAGQTVYVSVNGPNLPTSDATLTVTGDGIVHGPSVCKPNRFDGLNSITVQVTVSPNATPGMRSFVVRSGNNVAYANGYLEILPSFRDFNFDGLDDAFQRAYFAPWTTPASAPDADPDGDNFSNRFEFRTGTNPTDASSYSFLFESATTTRGGVTVTWKSDIGKRYQLYSRSSVDPTSSWVKLGDLITASSEMTSYSDRTAAGQPTRFYRLEILKP